MHTVFFRSVRIKARDQLEMFVSLFLSLWICAIYYCTDIFWCNFQELFLEQIFAKRIASSSASAPC